MQKTHFPLLFFSLLIISFNQMVVAQTWELVWAEEFDGSALDLTKWTAQIGDGCPDLCGWGNNELQ